jgi:hypothetical protein
VTTNWLDWTAEFLNRGLKPPQAAARQRQRIISPRCIFRDSWENTTSWLGHHPQKAVPNNVDARCGVQRTASNAEVLQGGTCHHPYARESQ